MSYFNSVYTSCRTTYNFGFLGKRWFRDAGLIISHLGFWINPWNGWNLKLPCLTCFWCPFIPEIAGHNSLSFSNSSHACACFTDKQKMIRWHIDISQDRPIYTQQRSKFTFSQDLYTADWLIHKGFSSNVQEITRTRTTNEESHNRSSTPTIYTTRKYVQAVEFEVPKQVGQFTNGIAVHLYMLSIQC